MAVPESVRDALAGRYLIQRVLGRGGMGVVYLAHDLRHDRPVALKLVRPGLAAQSDAERFQREIRLAARLQHPHILPVLDSGSIGTNEAGVEQLWFAMPFVDGESLYDRLNRERRLSLDVAIRITTEAARALEHAHQQGVVHRDVKPENILLTRDGTTLVGDFGLARALHADIRLTQSGTAIGTPFYMSPEQTNDGEVDGRTDEYSLAAVLYEMLTGEPPFPGRSLEAVVARRLSDPTPSARRIRDDLPDHVDEAIRKAMARAPADRFSTVTEFAQALQAPTRDASPVPAAVVTPWTGPGEASSRVIRAAIVLASGLLLIGGGLFAWRAMRSNNARVERGTPVVAVLPFDNLGDSADAYFADGVADEIRTKLAQVAGLQVIARGSSTEYRRTTSKPTRIARELGADYLLTGTVRWEKATGGSRVRVTPELVDARAGQVARTRWAQQFDASLTDVFQVQADIATKVADALGVALADSARLELALKPTESLAAYDEYLKGEAAAEAMKANQAGLHRAIAFYERAVALDSNFVQAWSALSRARSSLYSNGVPDPALGELARAAAERASALNPTEPLVYLALGDLYGSVHPIDHERAVAAYERGVGLAPDDADLLSALASAEASMARWENAAARLMRAARLDPRSTSVMRRLATVHVFLRHYAAADSAADRAIALAPTTPAIVLVKVMAAVQRGDREGARATVRSAAQRIDPATLYPFLASYQDLYWLLDDSAQQQVLAAPASAFDDDRAVWGLVRAELCALRGNRKLTIAYADSARLALEAQTRAEPEDGQRHVLLGLALSYLGRKADAIREGLHGVTLMPISRDGYFGPYVQLQLVRIYLLVGKPEQALDQLEPLLRVPFYLSPGWLRLDPTFDPVRNNPRFKKLVEARPDPG
jgi:serine/threonine-protein kinase